MTVHSFQHFLPLQRLEAASHYNKRLSSSPVWPDLRKAESLGETPESRHLAQVGFRQKKKKKAEQKLNLQRQD